MKSICYVGGCGRLGMALATWSAHKGFNVHVSDVNEAAVAAVNSGQFETIEPRVEAFVKEYAGQRLFATTDTEAAVAASEMSFIIVPTPSMEDGSFTVQYILEACKPIGAALARKDQYHVVVIASTVMPGHTGGVIREALEAASGRKAGEDFGLIYSPEFIRQGNIVYDFANPDQILIGQFDERSGTVAREYYEAILERETEWRAMSLVSAEIAKIGLNASVVTKLAIANQLAWICQSYPGASSKDVLESIGADARIGKKYLSAGPIWGGPCFPRDTRALVRAAEIAGATAPVAAAVDSFRDEQTENLASLVMDNLDDNTVTILGLTYKPGVDIVEESAGGALKQALDSRGCRTFTYDPAVTESHDLAAAVSASGTCVLMTPWPEFKEVENMDLSAKTIIDVWGFFDPEKLDCRRYLRVGEAGERTRVLAGE